MSGFLAAKSLTGLRPVDDAGQQALAKLGMGEVVRVEFKRPRNAKHHRLFWALMSLVHENLPEPQALRYPTVESLVAAFKILAGIRTEVHLPGNVVGFIPGSISFAKMDQAEFDAFFATCSDLIARHFLPGVDSAELRREVETMIGVRR